MSAKWFRIVRDNQILSGSLKIGCIILSPDSSSNVADVTLYDGNSSSGDKICVLYSGTGRSLVIPFHEPLHLTKGLYVDIGSNVSDLLVQLIDW